MLGCPFWELSGDNYGLLATGGGLFCRGLFEMESFQCLNKYTSDVSGRSSVQPRLKAAFEYKSRLIPQGSNRTQSELHALFK